MNRSEYESFDAEPAKPTINLDTLIDRSDRTLIYGYTCDRQTFHVYLRDGKLIRYIYGKGSDGVGRELIDTEFLPAEEYVPNKRIYPEASDAAFCRLLQEHGVACPFTTFDDGRPPQQYHGRIAII